MNNRLLATTFNLAGFLIIGMTSLVISTPLAAGTVQFQFSGVVIDRWEQDNSFGGLNLGDPLVATFVLDADSPDLLPADPASGRYNMISASFQLSHMIITQPGGVLDVYDGAAFDKLEFDSTGASFQIVALSSGEPTAFYGDTLPTVFPDMDHRRLNVYAKVGYDKFAATIMSTPEPTAILLLAAGLLFILRSR